MHADESWGMLARPAPQNSQSPTQCHTRFPICDPRKSVLIGSAEFAFPVEKLLSQMWTKAAIVTSAILDDN
jgi:hypothetical protein